jgi:two-component system, LytTR family, response regulator
MIAKPVRALIIDDEALGRERLRTFVEREPSIILAGEATDGDDAIAKVKALRPDLLFLDIQMPGKTGFEALAAMGDDTPQAVIFVTAHDEYALKAFEVHAVDYLLKPFDRARFQAAVQRAIGRLAEARGAGMTEALKAMISQVTQPPQAQERIPVKSNGRVFFVPLAEIEWVGSADNYVELHVGRQSHLIRGTLNQMETSLPLDRFVRVSRTAIVNVQAVKELSPLFHGEYAITLRSGAKVTLSRSHRDQLPRLGVK